jgi:hypothetical protein
LVERAEVVLPLAEEGDREWPCRKLAAAVVESISRLQRADWLGREEVAGQSQPVPVEPVGRRSAARVRRMWRQQQLEVTQ